MEFGLQKGYETFNWKSYCALHSGWHAKFSELGPLLQTAQVSGGFHLRFCCLLSCVCPDSWVWSLLFFLFSSSVLVGSGGNTGRAVGCWAASWAQCTTTKDILSFLSTKISFYAHQCFKFRKKLIKCGLISFPIKKNKQ